MTDQINRVVLAYSGGLDTSVILKWLQQTYNCEVVTFTADLGQGEELEPARAQGRDGGRQARAYLHRRSARGIRPRLRLPDDARQRAVRGAVPARHLDRAAADRQAPDRDREDGRRRCGQPRRDRQGQRPGPLRARLLRARARHQGDRAVARMGSDQPHRADRIRRAAPDPGPARTSAAKRRSRPTRTCCTPRPRARCSRIRGTRCPTMSIRAPSIRRTRPTRPSTSRSISSAATASRSTARAMSPGDAAGDAQRTRPHARHRPARSGREPLRRHEVARHVRDAGRHDLSPRASRHRAAHARSRRRASQGRAGAALCRADLQRLLVLARARDAAGGDRPQPGEGRRAPSGSSSTRAASTSSAASRRTRSIRKRS